MKAATIVSIGCYAVVGKISRDRIRIKMRTGNVRWLKIGAPVYQKVRFFDALFDDTVFTGSNATDQNIRYD